MARPRFFLKGGLIPEMQRQVEEKARVLAYVQMIQWEIGIEKLPIIGDKPMTGSFSICFTPCKSNSSRR